MRHPGSPKLAEISEIQGISGKRGAVAGSYKLSWCMTSPFFQGYRRWLNLQGFAAFHRVQARLVVSFAASTHVATGSPIIHKSSQIIIAMNLPSANEFRVSKTDVLTPREVEVLLWTAEGKTAWEAGAILGVTEGTVRIHLAHVLDKLTAANKPHAVAKAFAQGIICRKMVCTILAVIVAASVFDTAEASRMPRRIRTRTARAEAMARGWKRG